MITQMKVVRNVLPEMMLASHAEAWLCAGIAGTIVDAEPGVCLYQSPECELVRFTGTALPEFTQINSDRNPHQSRKRKVHMHTCHPTSKSNLASSWSVPK